ncbi:MULTISPECIES: ABC transporter permease [Microbacterium]|uniref:ABC transporter permease n=1 Tax=Microbacterium aquilitoris TaxID=3067307 RepID=A0ABU3GGJ0_9MICO|nr:MULTISPECIES: ABC transporter permease [unclassified Microbacterium]MDT3329817.1 ABC transporter permease [Microbacterium sp. KSW-18]MDT3345651.1 ABC transporter permease [Microbacterium sp. KSW2-22]
MSTVLPPAAGGSAADDSTVAVLTAGTGGAPRGGFWHDVFRRLRRSPTAWVGLAIVLLFVVVALLAPVLAPYPETDLPGARDITPTYIPGPGEIAAFPLGLDRFGGDVVSKLIWGAQASLLIGVVSTAYGLIGGMLLGLVAGTFGGWVDNVIMRLVDILLSVPSLLLAVSIAAILGQNQNSVMIAIGVAQVPIFARLLRASMLQQRSADYVLSAQTLGLGRGRITMTHVLPNAVGPVIVQGTLSLATAVIDAAALSFLGLGGGRPETAEWGRMLTYAQAELAIAPWLAFLPGICIAITALGFTLFGEALREAMDPRTRGR